MLNYCDGFPDALLSCGPMICPPYKAAILKYRSDHATPLLRVQRSRVNLDQPEPVMTDSFHLPLMDCGQKPSDSFMVTETWLLFLGSFWERSSCSLERAHLERAPSVLPDIATSGCAWNGSSHLATSLKMQFQGLQAKQCPQPGVPLLGPALPVRETPCH